MKKIQKGKIILIGNGAVGSSYAYASVIANVGRDLGIIDIDKKRTEGDIEDLLDATPFSGPKKIFLADYSDCADANVIVITAGFPQKPGESRTDLLDRNVKLMKQIVGDIMETGFNGVILVASNPVDIMAYAAQKYSGLPSNQVIGTGTLLDTGRFRKEVAKIIHVDPRNIHALILGEHGQSEFPVWSLANIHGIKITDLIEEESVNSHVTAYEIFEKVRDAAQYIIERKGATYYGIGATINRIVNAILSDEQSIMPLSVNLEGHYGIDNVYIGAPAVVGKHGIEKVLEIPLSEAELEMLEASANKLKGLISECKDLNDK